ncbi:MAG: cbb3-type cytochrome c oxidase subunit I [Desulfurococcales archaeon]|nr:cbb3-type cytochrome c oxidase subunit I [Desulfurococcales archaeon]
MARNGNGWSKVVLAAAILVYLVYFAGAAYTFQHLPPVPEEVRGPNGVLFTGNDIVEGKALVQRYGLQDYGSILGFGGYMGMDYTAYMLKFIQDAQNTTGKASVEQLEGGKIFVVSPAVEAGYQAGLDFFKKFFKDEFGENRLADGLLSDEDIRKIVSYYTWTALIAMQGYTNGFPYTPGLVEASHDPVRATWLTMFILLLVIMPLAGYVVIKFLDYWRDERIVVNLPSPSSAQRLALLGMALAMLGLMIQGLLGGYLMHMYTEPTMYGIDTHNILPFNVARGLHYNLAILWIAVTWVSFALFTLPYFGVKLTNSKALAILGAGGTVALLGLLGVWLSYLGKIPEPLWFVIGSQGRPVVSLGTLWLVLVAALLAYLALVTYKAARQNQYPFNALLKILSIGLAGTAMGAFIGALPFVKPFSNFTMDEYFRWITIHAFVEGFWPAIVIPILLILLVIAGLVPPKLAVAVAGLDASLEIATGMIGTAHHYYWGGEPTFWMYVGAAISTLEVLPIGFLIAYALVLWKRGEVKTELQKTLLTFVLVAAFGGAIGVVAFGAGLINLPVVNYYLHGSQATMVHAHLAMPLAYGVPTMLMWVVAFYLSGAVSDSFLRTARKAAILVGAGFYLQIILSLGILMLAQMSVAQANGYWAIKGLILPNGEPGLWSSMGWAIWARLVGDLVAALGIAMIAFPLLQAFPKALKSALGK